MAFRKQRKLFEVLKRYEKKFEPKERADYKMLVKRDKDEEELDSLSLERLEKLHEKYHLNREKKNFDGIFKEPDQSEENNNE